MDLRPSNHLGGRRYRTRPSKDDKEIRLSLKDHREIRPYDKHGAGTQRTNIKG